MSFPLVTVVTPSYNQAAYLEATIQSVLAQEYPNLEYIIVDGGSQDGSVEIIQKYANHLASWVSEPDHGQADAINKGLRQAKGEIVAWLNSDDLYLPNAIHEGVALLTADSTLGMVYGDAVTIDPQGRPLNKLAFGDWNLTDLMRFRIICQPAVFMRRRVLEQAGYLEENFHFMLDHQLWLRIAAEGAMRYAPNLWAAARHHPSAKNVAHSTGFAEEAFQVLDWLKTEPKFAPRFTSDRRRILGGANRLAGRYFLDGGQPGRALQAYTKGLFYWPNYTAKHWGRIAFAVFNLLGIGDVTAWSRRQPPDLTDPLLQNWPGINLT
jgi:glycosyltransferase involved in cell wall biosynthesis